MDKICVLGLGYIGLPTSITLALSGAEVVGVDIRASAVETLRAGRIPIVEPGLQEAFDEAVHSGRLRFETKPQPAEAFIITVQTPHRDRADGVRVSDLSFVESAARSLGPVLQKGNLVVLESTVPPGTCRWMEGILSQESGLGVDDFFVVHCPERVIPGHILQELRENDRVVGARVPQAAELACAVYRRVVTKGALRVTDDITAEMCKLVENTFRDINIAYANELSVVADKLGIDVFRLIELANCHPRVNILTPGVGVGGHCIAVDPWFIHEKFPEDTPLIGTARRVNDAKPGRVREWVARAVPPSQTVAVLGLSYKPDIDDLRESPAIELCHLLQKDGYRVLACEPHVRDGEIQGIANVSLDEALEADFVVLTLGHTVFKKALERIEARPHLDCVGLTRRTESRVFAP